MTRHPLDGNAIAADAYYGREEPEMRECDQCEGTGYMREETAQWACHVCGGSGEVSVEQEEPDDDYEYERRRDSLADRG